MIEHFSSAYYMVDAEVVPYNGDEVIAQREFLQDVMEHTRFPLFKIGNGHYWAEPERSVPSQTVAVPDDVQSQHSEPVLVAKNNKAFEIVTDGEVVNE